MTSTPAAATSRGSAASTQPGRGPARAPRPTLRVVSVPASDRGRTVFVGMCLLLLGGGLLALLLLNTAMANGSFRLHDLQATSDQLGDREQALRQDIAVQAAPERLAARAKALGMVPSDSAAFLRLSDGKVLGVAHPATVPPTPTVSAQPTTKQSATPPNKTQKQPQKQPQQKQTAGPTTSER
jgi:hypothetical protein